MTEIFTDVTREVELRCWAEQHGVEAPLILLAAELARGSMEGQQAFIEEFVFAVKKKCPGKNVARQWLIWLWDKAEDSISVRLSRREDRLAAEEIINMHRRMLVGEIISAGAWRAARKAFTGALIPDTHVAAAEAILSSMWDWDQMPGAVADVASSWIRETALFDAIERTGWSWLEYCKVQATWDAFGIAFSQIAKRSDENETEFQARKRQYMELYPPAISDDEYAKWKAMTNAQEKISAQRVAELRRGVLKMLS